MISQKRKVLLSVGAGLLLLSFWGWWGGGTASHLFPEEKAASSPALPPESDAEKEDALPEGGEETGRLVYDTSTHLRDHPLRDPFHADAVGREEEARKAPPEAPVKPAPAAAAVLGREKRGGAARPKAAGPVLKGILSYGDKKRAMVEVDGAVETLAVGEQAGPWTVLEIGEKSVTLGAGDTVRTLTAR